MAMDASSESSLVVMGAWCAEVVGAKEDKESASISETIGSWCTDISTNTKITSDDDEGSWITIPSKKKKKSNAICSFTSCKAIYKRTVPAQTGDDYREGCCYHKPQWSDETAQALFEYLLKVNASTTKL